MPDPTPTRSSPPPAAAITRTLRDRGPLTSDALFAALLDEHGLPEDRAREVLAGCVRAGRIGIVVEDRVARWRAT